MANTPLANSVPVQVGRDGQLGTGAFSSRRYKSDIADMGDHSNAILELRPVVFRYRPDLDPNGRLQRGLIAEEVAEVLPELVVYDREGRPQMVRYQELPTLLLNELQRQHRNIEEQAQTILALTARLARLEARSVEPEESH